MYSFIGGSTVVGKQDRRVNHRREKSFMKKLGRPREMLLPPDSKHKAGRAPGLSPQATPEHSVQHSRQENSPVPQSLSHATALYPSKNIWLEAVELNNSQKLT